MSRNWAEYGVGCVLTGDEINRFVEALSEDECGKIEDVYDYLETLSDDDRKLVRYYDSDFDDQVFRGIDVGVYDEPESMLVFWAKHQTSLFAPAYANREEIIEEFKERIGKFLPDDFKYSDHIGYFSCTVYC